jgi:hypothetical protein
VESESRIAQRRVAAYKSETRKLPSKPANLTLGKPPDRVISYVSQYRKLLGAPTGSAFSRLVELQLPCLAHRFHHQPLQDCREAR